MSNDTDSYTVKRGEHYVKVILLKYTCPHCGIYTVSNPSNRRLCNTCEKQVSPEDLEKAKSSKENR